MDLKGEFENFEDKDYRPGQEETIKRVLEGDKKVAVIHAPTGSGKSLDGMCIGAYYKKAAYLCSTKQLQRQLVNDFPEAMYMMGRNNFRCNVEPDTRTCDTCTHTQITPCKLKAICNYDMHKHLVLRHSLQILNYHYILNEANWVGQFSEYPMIICDEADALEGLLTSFIELRLSENKLKDLDLAPPRFKTSTAKKGLKSWQEWAQGEAKVKVSNRLRALEAIIENLDPEHLTPDEVQTVREHKSLEALYSKITIFSNHMDESWIFQEIAQNGKPASWVFQPTWLTQELAEQYLWRHGERFVLMSATFPPKAVLAEMLGLNAGDIDMIELPSQFPVGNRPVYLDPVADMSYNTFDRDLPLLLERIEQILNKHPDEKGLIHTVSWKLDQQVMRSINNPRLIFHSSKTKDEQLKRFMESSNGVFVSPSSTRGVDLPDDLCRFIVVAKAPFQSLGDKLVSSRVYGGGLGAYWYRAICAQDIVQASGRGVRHANDYCVTYLLDKQIEKLVVDNQSLFPRYWMEAVDYL